MYGHGWRCVCGGLEHVSPQCRLNVSVDKVTSGDRERAKRVVYAIVYGVGIGLWQLLEMRFSWLAHMQVRRNWQRY